MCIPVRTIVSILHNIMHFNTVRMCMRACVQCVGVWLVWRNKLFNTMVFVKYVCIPYEFR